MEGYVELSVIVGYFVILGDRFQYSIFVEYKRVEGQEFWVFDIVIELLDLFILFLGFLSSEMRYFFIINRV